MNVFSWLPRNLTEAERHLLQTLEHRRLSNRGQLFALIADPNRRFRRICSLYLAWLQRHAMPEANAAIGVPWLADRDVPPLSPRRLNRFLGSEPVKPVRHTSTNSKPTSPPGVATYMPSRVLSSSPRAIPTPSVAQPSPNCS